MPKALVSVLAFLHPNTSPRLPSLRYTGSLYGVHVQIDVNETPRGKGRAAVLLHGVPMGGSIRGNAYLGLDGNVVMDPALNRALTARRVSLLSVARSQTGLRVVLKLPVLGCRTACLQKTNPQPAETATIQ